MNNEAIVKALTEASDNAVHSQTFSLDLTGWHDSPPRSSLAHRKSPCRVAIHPTPKRVVLRVKKPKTIPVPPALSPKPMTLPAAAPPKPELKEVRQLSIVEKFLTPSKRSHTPVDCRLRLHDRLLKFKKLPSFYYYEWSTPYRHSYASASGTPSRRINCRSTYKPEQQKSLS